MSEWLPERLPEDPEAERSLLATLCAPGRDLEAAEFGFVLCENDFVHPAHRGVFKAMLALIHSQTEINPLTMKDALDRSGELGRVGGYPGLVDLLGAEEVGRPQVLVDILQRKRRLRQLIRMGASLVRSAAEEQGEPLALVRNLSMDLGAMLQSGSGRKKTVHVSQVTDGVLASLMDRMQGTRSKGVRIGYDRLDRVTDGLPRGGLIVLAARPGVGKSALAVNWLHRAARRGVHGALFTLEMTRDEVGERLLAAEAKVDLKAATGNGYNELVMQTLARAKAVVDEYPLHIDDQATTTAGEIVAKIHQLHAATEGALELVVVDYLQLIQKPDIKGRNEASLIGDITRALKLCAKDLGIPIVILSQLNREVEKRTHNTRPILSDLKDSGSIEQDADMVLFIHRNTKPSAMGEAPDLSADLIIAKHRNGPLLTIPMVFKAEWTTYHEVEGTTDAVARVEKPALPKNLYE